MKYSTGICLNETWTTNLPHLRGFLEDYDGVWVNGTKSEGIPGYASGGLASLFKKNELTTTTIKTCDTWIVTKSIIDDLVLIICSVYFKPSADFVKLIDNLGTLLNELTTVFPEALLIIGGDFNCRMGEIGYLPEEITEGISIFNKRQSLDKTLNKKGNILNDTMADYGFALLNGRSRSDRIGQFTFCSEKKTVQSIKMVQLVVAPST